MTNPDDLPIINPAKCTGCGRCVPICPAECLEMIGALPWLPRPRDCVSCTACAAVCPAEAILWIPETVSNA